AGDIDLSPHVGGIFHLYPRPEPKADGLTDQGKRPADQCLACDDGCHRGDHDADQQKLRWDDSKKGVDPSQVRLMLQHRPGTLAKIVQDQGDLDKGPAPIDIMASAMSEIAIQGLRTRSTKKDGAQHPEPMRMLYQQVQSINGV